MKKKLTTLVEVKTPMTPNFIATENGDHIPVTDFSEPELREIGKAWTEALIVKRRRGISGPR
jgi:hypothetical protein